MLTDAQGIGQRDQMFPIDFAFLTFHLRVSDANDSVNGVGASINDAGHRSNHLLQPFARIDQAKSADHFLVLQSQLGSVSCCLVRTERLERREGSREWTISQLRKRLPAILRQSGS